MPCIDIKTLKQNTLPSHPLGVLCDMSPAEISELPYGKAQSLAEMREASLLLTRQEAARATGKSLYWVDKMRKRDDVFFAVDRSRCGAVAIPREPIEKLAQMEG